MSVSIGSDIGGLGVGSETVRSKLSRPRNKTEMDDRGRFSVHGRELSRQHYLRCRHVRWDAERKHEPEVRKDPTDPICGSFCEKNGLKVTLLSGGFAYAKQSSSNHHC